LLVDTAGRAETEASLWAIDVLEHPDDNDRAVRALHADRIARDLHRLVIEFGPSVVETRSRAWGDAA
jgi:hypothetical protein